MNHTTKPSQPMPEHEFPPEDALAIKYAAPISLCAEKPRHGWSDLHWESIFRRWAPRYGGFDEIMASISEGVLLRDYRLLLFLPGTYDITMHIRSVRQNLNEIGMMNSWQYADFKFSRKPVTVDLLLVRDIRTLYGLARRSNWLARLVHIVEGQPEDETWFYFLNPPEVVPEVRNRNFSRRS